MFWGYHVRCIHIEDLYAFLVNWPFCHHAVSLLILGNCPYSEVYFDSNTATPDFFALVFAWCIFFYPLTFNLWLYLKWVLIGNIYFSFAFLSSLTVCDFNFVFRRFKKNPVLDMVGLKSAVSLMDVYFLVVLFILSFVLPLAFFKPHFGCRSFILWFPLGLQYILLITVYFPVIFYCFM